jgi:hypothetical protein
VQVRTLSLGADAETAALTGAHPCLLARQGHFTSMPGLAQIVTRTLCLLCLLHSAPACLIFINNHTQPTTRSPPLRGLRCFARARLGPSPTSYLTSLLTSHYALYLASPLASIRGGSEIPVRATS